MAAADTNQDGQVSWDEFLNTAQCLSCTQGLDTSTFNRACQLVARFYVGKRDNKVRCCWMG